MNVYDFDKTIYNGDSTVNFYKYCIRKRPVILKYLPKQLWAVFMYFIKVYDKTKMKENFYRFLQGIDDVDALLISFWEENMAKIKAWYIESKRDDDVIISASPEFLLEIPCKILNVKMMASRVCKKTGKYDGVNCHGKEKVKRFYKEFADGAIDEFYSDSYSDTPLAKISKKAYMVKGNKIFDWK
ncbi:MAG: HAD-IB family phosphatase [Clostridia bacterium]|nr:HAD-IB family phosphatase [Clostridia bacterium]